MKKNRKMRSLRARCKQIRHLPTPKLPLQQCKKIQRDKSCTKPLLMKLTYLKKKQLVLTKSAKFSSMTDLNLEKKCTVSKMKVSD